jgi:hypothetical protein
MKKFSFILVAFLLIAAIVGTTYYINRQNAGKHEISISDAFNSSGAKMVVNESYFFARVTDNFKTMDNITNVCKEVYKALEITNYSTNATSTDIMLKTDFLGATRDGVKVSAMASIVGNKSGAGDKYITVDAIGTDKSSALLLRDDIEKVFDKYGLKAVVNNCITGTYDGNVQDTQLEGICRKILNDSDAKKVDSLRQDNTISVSAFTPMIKDKLDVNGKNVNLSIAIRYNKLENKTYLWVATPIVNAEY